VEEPVPLDPQVQAMRDRGRDDPTPPLYEMSLAQAREHDLASIEASRGAVAPVDAVLDLAVPAPGRELAARLYRPAGPGPLPVLVYLFGGGWTLGTLDTCDAICRQLCVDASCLVLSVQYRTAPEHKFPAAPEDCYAAVRWIAGEAAGLGGDPARIAVAGDSSGGNLAAAVTLLARQRGGPELTCQVLVYPNTDYRSDTPSMRENADRAFFNRQSVAWYWHHYLANEADGDNPLASPLRADDLRGLPPALMITAEYDPLRDEAEAYADRLREAGVPVTLTRYDGMIHGFFTMSGMLNAGRIAVAQAAGFLTAAFTPIP
jgi:acetyl esterase